MELRRRVRMSNNVFIKALVFERNSEGEFIITKVGSNKGKFKIEQEVNDELLEKEIVERFTSYVVSQMRPCIEEFVNQEEVDKTA